MDHSSYEENYIKTILSEVKTIALLGASANPARPSNQVLKFLLSAGYIVIPINPGLAGSYIENQKTYASLAEIDASIDMVDIFRNNEAVPAIVEECLQLKPLPKVIWMQIGVENFKSAKQAEDKNIKIVMNRCPKIEIDKLRL